VADLLMPFLLSNKVADVNAPNDKEARKANRDARAAYRDMLAAREGIVSRRLDEEKEKLMRRQQAFSRVREHTGAETAAFEAFVADATFKVAILEQRLARGREVAPARVAAFEKTLEADPRLAAIFNPALYKLRMEAKE